MSAEAGINGWYVGCSTSILRQRCLPCPRLDRRREITFGEAELNGHETTPVIVAVKYSDFVEVPQPILSRLDAPSQITLVAVLTEVSRR